MAVLGEGVGLVFAGLAVACGLEAFVACDFELFVAWSVELTHDNVSRQNKATIAVHRYHRLSIGVLVSVRFLQLSAWATGALGPEVRQWLRDQLTTMHLGVIPGNCQ